ncbi:MAG: cohesin domain-containing protein [Chloroflexota bacterium]|nr:cohesin domain-containing protein [Chloroflexota bacterium]
MRVVSLLLALFLVFLVLPLTTAAQDGSTLQMTMPDPDAHLSAGDSFVSVVSVQEVEGLLGFQFDINFDPGQLAVESVELGPFLASTGRSPQPLGPDVRDAAEGRVVFGGFTLGKDQPGASGEGVLATILWRVVAPGEHGVTLDSIQLAGSTGAALPVSDEVEVVPEAEVVSGGADSSAAGDVGSLFPGGFPRWLPVVAVVGLVLLVGILLARVTRRSSVGA